VRTLEQTSGNTDSPQPIQTYVFGYSSTRNTLLFLLGSVFLVVVPLHALPIKPRIEDVIREAKKPPEKFVPARAGWNGPEEKSAVAAPNATYERLRQSMSPEAARMQLLQAAKPDWRLLLAVAGVIFFWRYKRTNEHPLAPRGQGSRPEVVPIAIASRSDAQDKQAA
jgi:hypothetical protein